MKTQIIAEVGECFNGNIDTALEMIREAKKAGCDIVKFQLLDISEVAKDDPEYDWFAGLDLPVPRMQALIKEAEKQKIDILFTPVSVETAGNIYETGQRKVKIASSFIRKRELLDYINSHFETVYLSTGMAELQEIRQAVAMLQDVREIVILHCVSEYPTGPLLEQRGLKALDENDAHLNMIRILKREFPDFRIEYSDHTEGIFVPVIAAAMGAEVIEKHFTLDRRTPIQNFLNKGKYLGTDHVLSVEPNDLHTMVDQIRRAETCQGEMCWSRSPGEKILLDFLRNRYVKREG